MEEDIENIIKNYKKNNTNAIRYTSYIIEVREYDGYIFKEINSLDNFKNESKWLKKLMDFNYCTPKILGTYDDKIIIMEKIDGKAINDEESKDHLYNIGKLMVNLHNVEIEANNDWNNKINSEYLDLRESAKNVMEKDVFEITTKFLDKELPQINVSKYSLIHRDLRPENVIYSNGEYYLLDLESMCVGDRDYDFTRMLNLLNQKKIYQYEDLKNLLDGYRSINSLELSEENGNYIIDFMHLEYIQEC